MAMGSWDKEGVINTVDGQLKRPQKEGKVQMQQEGKSTPCQDSR